MQNTPSRGTPPRVEIELHHLYEMKNYICHNVAHKEMLAFFDHDVSGVPGTKGFHCVIIPICETLCSIQLPFTCFGLLVGQVLQSTSGL
jgi:hypothetical protein